MVDLNSKAGAIIIDGYRYVLWRNWVPNNRRRLLWVMLNPSTADAVRSDRTLTSCRRFTEQWGFGGLEIVNLFAYVSSDPQTLSEVSCPVGSENDRYVGEAAKRASTIVVAWGAWEFKDISGPRASAVVAVLKQYFPAELKCLGRTQDGCPCHPARLGHETELRSFS